MEAKTEAHRFGGNGLEFEPAIVIQCCLGGVGGPLPRQEEPSVGRDRAAIGQDNPAG